MQISQIPNKLAIPFANSGTKTTIPQASQISVTPGAASLTDGFPPLTMTALAAGGVPPFGADFNGILNWLSTISQWSNAGGMYQYDSTFSASIGGYPKGAILVKANFSGAWMSTVDNNTTNPDTGGAGWATIASTSPSAPLMTFAQVASLSADQGPIRVSDMGDSLYTWTTSAYFTGYRNVNCGAIPQNMAANPRAWELATIGGTWNTSDPKQNRVIAWFQEQGLTIASGSWAPGMGFIASLGSGNWKAPDLRNVFLRMSGTDADTANARPAGTYQADASQKITGQLQFRPFTSPGAWGPAISGTGAFANPMQQGGSSGTGTVAASGSGSADIYNFDSSQVVRASKETRGASTAVSAVILV